jgi:hypothetical protein
MDEVLKEALVGKPFLAEKKSSKDKKPAAKKSAKAEAKKSAKKGKK